MFLKTQVIVNPESNKGKTRKRWKDIQEALKSFLKEFKCEFTEKPFQGHLQTVILCVATVCERIWEKPVHIMSFIEH